MSSQSVKLCNCEKVSQLFEVTRLLNAQSSIIPFCWTVGLHFDKLLDALNSKKIIANNQRATTCITK